MMVRGLIACALAALALIAIARADTSTRAFGAAQGEAPVSVAIVLAADVSASINTDRFKLQREGYAAALTHPRVMDAIRGTGRSRIAVVYIEWSDESRQMVVVPWTVIATEADALRFASILLAAPRSSNGMTAVGAGLAFAALRLELCPFAADRQVIDMSGDGPNNDGPRAEPIRDRLALRGVTINAIVILGGDPTMESVDLYYRESVIGGPGAFVIVAEGFETFAYAIVAKLVREVAGSPRPVAQAPAMRTAGAR